MSPAGNLERDKRIHASGVQVHKQDPSTWSKEAPIEWVDEALIVVTKAFCPHGHELITAENAAFSGYVGLRVRVKALGATQDVVLSPIHGHHDRVGGESIPAGTRCSVRCPVCNEELPEYAPCPCGEGTLRAIYLTPAARGAHVAAICDVWGCQRSRVVDEWEILSEFVAEETREEGQDA